jgi:cell division protease FtsH
MNNKKPQKPDQNKDNDKKIPKMKKSHSITFWVVLILFILLMYQMSRMGEREVTEIKFSEFMSMARDNQISEVEFRGRDVHFTDVNDNQYTTHIPYEDPELVKEISNLGISVESSEPSRFWSVILSFLPFLILIGLWLFIIRGMRGGATQAFSFGKSKARLSIGDKTKITFKDVAGVNEAKEELEEIVDFLKTPKKFQQLGGRIPRGVLLLGRPGTGKTLLAKAVAGEAKVPFYSISGSDFVEMFVGVGASRVRDMFSEAKKNAPCITFIDEIDAVGRHRGSGLGGGHDEREQTLNQLLVEMDGFEPNDSVIIIAATNRPDVLDPALLRPGRFDRQIVVDLPDIKGRTEILKVHTRQLPIDKNVNFSIIARSTPGFSGADLANLVNEAALLAARKNKKNIELEDFEEARDKITLGKAKKSRVISEEEKKVTAYHEIGHVLCSVFQPKSEPVHKVSIIPRGFTGGATQFLQTDKTNYTKSYLLDMLVGLMGGRAAEEIMFDEISTGAANDIQRTTDLVNKMVTLWGMSDKIGPMNVGKDDSQVFLGRELTRHETFSEETARLIDSEVRNIIVNSHTTAKEILKSHKDLLKILAEELLERETLNVDDIFTIILDNIGEDEKELIQKKYEKAKEMKMDTLHSKKGKQDQEELKFEEEENNTDDDSEESEDKKTEDDVGKERNQESKKRSENHSDEN